MSWKDSTLKYVKELMKPKPISEIIEKEMREAVIKKLEAESAVEYARSIVQYNQQRIERLEKRLYEHSDGGGNDSRAILLSMVIGWSASSLLATPTPMSTTDRPLTTGQLQAKAKARSLSNVCKGKRKSKTVKDMCRRWEDQQNG